MGPDEGSVETLRLVYEEARTRRDDLQQTLRGTVAQLSPFPASAAVVVALFAALGGESRPAFGLVLVGLALFLTIVGFSTWLATIGLRRLKVGRGHEGDFEVHVPVTFDIGGSHVEQRIGSLDDSEEYVDVREIDPGDPAAMSSALAEGLSQVVPSDDSPLATWLRKTIALTRAHIIQLEHSLERAQRLLTAVQLLLGVEVTYLLVLFATAAD